MEEQELIYLAACAVNRKTPDPERVAAMDLDALYELAEANMLAATLAPALKAAGVQDRRFIRAFEHAVLKSSTMDMEMEALFAELEAAGIWYMPLKGTVLQHLFPIYGMRQMTDHDILFDPDRADEVRTIMEALGFRVKSFGTGYNDAYVKPPVSNFEMHRALFSSDAKSKQLYAYYQDVRSRLLGDGLEKHFSPEDFYLYMTAHAYKHYLWRGADLRSMLDTYVYLQKQTPDMDYVTAEAEKMGMARFEDANRSLAQRLFSGGELSAEDRELLNCLRSAGASEGYGLIVENRIRKQGHGKLRYTLGRFLVPMRKTSKGYAAFAKAYPLFYQHRLLLPILPFYRTLRAVKSGRIREEANAIKKAKPSSQNGSYDEK